MKLSRKSHLSRPPRKLPRARVMFHQGCANPFAGMRQDKNELYDRHCAVIPCPTAKQARALARWHNLTEGERCERLVKVFKEHFDWTGNYELSIKACLAAMNGGAPAHLAGGKGA